MLFSSKKISKLKKKQKKKKLCILNVQTDAEHLALPCGSSFSPPVSD